MNSLHLFFLVILFGLVIRCTPDNRCEDVDCGPGNCVDGVCECPDGFYGEHCEIEQCFGLDCVNGDCDPLTKTCICNSNYYGESCNIKCVNGEFENGTCHCSEGYEGIACEIESRNGFLGWWACQEWSWTSVSVDSTFQGSTLGTIKMECGFGVPQIELFPTVNNSGLMLLETNNRIVGDVSGKTINFKSQSLTTELSVYGSGSFGDGRNLNIELYFSNSATLLTEVARGSFTLYRLHTDCN